MKILKSILKKIPTLFFKPKPYNSREDLPNFTTNKINIIYTMPQEKEEIYQKIVTLLKDKDVKK